MTVTDLSPTVVRRRVRPARESERLAELEAMLSDPRWSHCVVEIRQAIVYLTATSVLAA